MTKCLQLLLKKGIFQLHEPEVLSRQVTAVPWHVVAMPL